MITMGLLVSGKPKFTLQSMQFSSDQFSIKKTIFGRVDFLKVFKYTGRNRIQYDRSSAQSMLDSSNTYVV